MPAARSRTSSSRSGRRADPRTGRSAGAQNKRRRDESLRLSPFWRWRSVRRGGGLLARLTLELLREILAGRLVDALHRQLDLTAVVEADQLDLHGIADLDHVGGLV